MADVFAVNNARNNEIDDDKESNGKLFRCPNQRSQSAITLLDMSVTASYETHKLKNKNRTKEKRRSKAN